MTSNIHIHTNKQYKLTYLLDGCGVGDGETGQVDQTLRRVERGRSVCRVNKILSEREFAELSTDFSDAHVYVHQH